MTTYKKLGFLGLGGLLVAAIVTGGVQGYSTGSETWPSQDVFYYINPTNQDVSNAAAIAAIRQGALEWSAESDASVQLVYGGTTTASSLANDGKNNVFFRDQSNGDTIAYTYRWWNGAGDLLDADIVFYDASHTFFTGSTGCTGGGVYVEDLAAHEFGHVLGLDHSEVSQATMDDWYNACSTWMRSLSSDDVAGIESLYPPTGSTPPPAAPSGLTAVPNADQPDGKVDLQWVDAPDESTFQIERSVDGQTFQFVGQTGQNDTTYTDAAVSSDSPYWYQVRSSNTHGQSSPSNVAFVQTSETPAPDPDPDPDTDPPTAASNPSPGHTQTYVSRDTDLGWLAGANVASYDVYFGQSSSPSLYQAGVTGTSLNLPRLGKNKTYHWRIVAKNSLGQATSSVWWFSTGGGPNSGGPGGGRGRPKRK